jgi:hypothetical protein
MKLSQRLKDWLEGHRLSDDDLGRVFIKHQTGQQPSDDEISALILEVVELRVQRAELEQVAMRGR